MKRELSITWLAGIIGFGLLVSCSSLPSELQKGVEAGDAEALYKAGEHYSEKKNQNKALSMFLAAAEQGHAVAQNRCGRYYDEGWGTAEDNAKAVYWYAKSAEQNNEHAICNLAYMYAGGEGVPSNKQQAIELFKKALKINPSYEAASNGLYSTVNNGYAPENLKGKTLVLDYTNAYYYDYRGIKTPCHSEVLSFKFVKPNKYMWVTSVGDGWRELTYRKIDKNTAVISHYYGSDGDPAYYTAKFEKPNEGVLIFSVNNGSECCMEHEYNIKFRIK